MSREIKFKRVFLRDDTGKFSHFSEWGVNINKADFVSPGNCNFAYASVDLQYTGLKDKNGKEIYGDDILNHPAHPGIVTCHNGSWGTLHKSGAFASFYANVVNGCVSHEIIGNIHENPELLNA